MIEKRMYKCVFTVVLLLLTALLSLGITSFAAVDDNWASGQIAVQEPNTPAEDSAYIIFSEKAQMEGMSYITPDGAGRYDELYSEQVKWLGVPAIQVYMENYLYFKIDDDFADAQDSVFSLTFDYWDYGGGGYFYVDYIPRGSTEYTTLKILKLGLDEAGAKTSGTWFRVTVYIDDADFSGRMDYGADFRIRSGAYNSFSKVEVRNLTKTAKDENFGSFNLKNAKALNILGVYKGYGNEDAFEPCLDKQLTREEAIVHLITCYGLEEEAIKKNISSTMKNISKDASPYVGLAESMGIFDDASNIHGDETFTQKELLMWYLRLFGVEDENIEENAYILAKNYGIIHNGSIIFQPEKKADIDAFVVMAMNVFAKDNLKTGYNPLQSGLDNGKYNYGTVLQLGEKALAETIIKSEFKLPKTEHVDSMTGRKYYTVNLFGTTAVKGYYTQNCMTPDKKRIYFRTADWFLMEYNIETEMCKYIDDIYTNGNPLITPLNNVWYVRNTGEIVKMNVDTYEKTVVCSLPDYQIGASLTLLQVNDDESKLSLYWLDKSGEFDAKLYSNIPIYDIKKGEWELSHVWGFSTKEYPPNHQGINPNPKYSNLFHFAHEGRATYSYIFNTKIQYDRTWLVNTDTNEFYNAIEQKWLRSPKDGDFTTGWTGEGLTHEAWSYDGEWLFAMKKAQFSNGLNQWIGPGHIIMQKTDGSEKRYIPARYDITWRELGFNYGPLHGMLSHNNRWFAADHDYGSSRKCDLYLIDAETSEAIHLARLPETGSDPGHIHPQWSSDDSIVIFGCWSEDLKCAQFGWMDVSDIITNAAAGSRFDLSDSCESLSYECSLDHYVKPDYTEDGELSCVKIPSGNKMYVNVKSEVTEKNNTPATVTVTYKDNAYLPIRFSYYTWNENGHKDRNVLAEHSLYIERNGTGKILTKTFTFKDICLSNMEILGTDFTIGGVCSEAEIISVTVQVPEGQEESK